MDLGHRGLVPYREGLILPVEVTYTHKKQSGGGGEFAAVAVRLYPGTHGQGITFVNSVKGDNVPREFIPSVEKGVREQAEAGHQFGFPIIDFAIELLDGKHHDLDSSALAFETAGRGAMREGAQRSGTKLLEPIMKVEVLTPADIMGDVIADLDSRRGQIQLVHGQNDAQVIEAIVPLANMLDYVSELRSLSQGRATTHTLQFSHYDEVQGSGAPPDEIA